MVRLLLFCLNFSSVYYNFFARSVFILLYYLFFLLYYHLKFPGIVEGVFRLSGSRSTIQEIQEKFNKGETVDFSKVNDIHVVTGVFIL
jgi:hypothetical protein